MRPSDEQQAPLAEGLRTDSAGRTPDKHSSRQPRTQLEVVLRLLMLKDECCGAADFYASYIPRYSAHIYTLRRQGYVITRDRCTRHNHTNPQYTYKLVALPHDPSERAS